METLNNTWPKVSIVTINYNGLELTRKLLSSLAKVSYPNYEVIVVDNASKESPATLSSEFPWIKLILNPINEGFAGGNNRGFEVADGAYLLMLNNDTEVPVNFLEPLVSRFLSDERIGVVCPKILYFDNPKIIQYAGYTPIHSITGQGFGIGFNENDQGQYDEARETARAHGAAMMISRQAFEVVGPMFEDYFLYYEEMDYNASISKAGFLTWYEPKSFILHKESMTVGAFSEMKMYYMSRNRLMYMRRQIDWPLFGLALLYYLFIAVPKNSLVLIIRRKFPHLRAFWRGLIWHLKSNPTDKF